MSTIRSARFSHVGVLLLGLLGACGGSSGGPPADDDRDDAGGGKLDGSSGDSGGGDQDAGGDDEEDGSIDLDARMPCGLTSCSVGQRCQGDGTCADVACSE